jgi:hypothetical protein
MDVPVRDPASLVMAIVPQDADVAGVHVRSNVDVSSLTRRGSVASTLMPVQVSPPR